MEVTEVREIFLDDEGVRCTFSTGSCSTTDTVNKDTRASREIIVDDMVHDGDIETTGSYVCDDENVGLVITETGKLLLTGNLVERTVNERGAVAGRT